jgi:hypothetical protein
MKPAAHAAGAAFWRFSLDVDAHPGVAETSVDALHSPVLRLEIEGERLSQQAPAAATPPRTGGRSSDGLPDWHRRRSTAAAAAWATEGGGKSKFMALFAGCYFLFSSWSERCRSATPFRTAPERIAA